MQIAYFGVDPGLTGAIALIPPEGDAYAQVYDFTDPQALALIRDAWEYNLSGMLEHVHAMPMQGIVSTSKFMANFGVWQGRLEVLEVPFGFVTPQKWQKQMFGQEPKIFKVEKKKKVVDTKAMSLAVARRMFPHLASKLKAKNSHNRADALLIAKYARGVNKGE